jgi:hypothetical protein
MNSLERIAEIDSLTAENKQLKIEVQAASVVSADYLKQIEQLKIELEQSKTAYYEMCGAYEADKAKLQAELAEAKEQNRWIPVSERLPEKEVTILLLIKNKNHTYWFLTGCYDDGMYKTHVGPVYEVTHWKPITLPE